MVLTCIVNIVKVQIIQSFYQEKKCLHSFSWASPSISYPQRNLSVITERLKGWFVLGYSSHFSLAQQLLNFTIDMNHLEGFIKMYLSKFFSHHADTDSVVMGWCSEICTFKNVYAISQVDNVYYHILRNTVITYIMLIFLITVKIKLYFPYISIPTSIFSCCDTYTCHWRKVWFWGRENPIWVFKFYSNVL